MNKKKLATIALIPALAAGAFASYAFAASDTTTKNTPSTKQQKRGMHGKGSDMFASNLATALGLQVADVKAKLDAGQTPDQIITATGQSKDTVIAALQAARVTSMKARIAEKVASGKITQAQADNMITRITNNTGHQVGERGMRGIHGPHGDHGLHMKKTSTQ